MEQAEVAVLLPEVLAVEELDREPQRVVPRVVCRCLDGEQCACGCAHRVEIRARCVPHGSPGHRASLPARPVPWQPACREDLRRAIAGPRIFWRPPAAATMSPRTTPRHDHDAGGDAEVLAAKAERRQEVWAALDHPGIARFPKPTGRIPNFVGAEAAARRLAETDEWKSAATVKANPDSPQWPVRTRALVEGKVVFMAVPRLAEPEPFFLLDPERAGRLAPRRELDQGRVAQRAARRPRRARTGRSRGDRMRRGGPVRRATRQGWRVQRPRARGGGRSGPRRREHDRGHDGPPAPGARCGRDPDDRARHPRRPRRDAGRVAAVRTAREAGACRRSSGPTSPPRRSPRSRCSTRLQATAAGVAIVRIAPCSQRSRWTR